MKTAYKIISSALMLLGVAACSQRQANTGEGGAGLMAINAGNGAVISSINSSATAREYAIANDYYNSKLSGGMAVYFATSYGADGREAGQSAGTLVAGADGSLLFRATSNPTSQLLLPPGGPFNSNGGLSGSLWDFGTANPLYPGFPQVANRIAFAETAEGAAGGTAVYDQVAGEIVNFQGGTAGRSAQYTEALKLTLSKRNQDSSTSRVELYFAKGLGWVAQKFAETGSVGGSVLCVVDANPSAGSSARTSGDQEYASENFEE